MPLEHKRQPESTNKCTLNMATREPDRELEERQLWRGKIRFLERWLFPSSFAVSPLPLNPGRRAIQVTTSGRNGRSIEESLAQLRNDYEALLQMHDMQATYVMSRKSRLWQPLEPLYCLREKEQSLLVRGFFDGSHSRYDEQLGITCSGFAACSPCADLENLRDIGAPLESQIRDHCGGEASSRFISATDDPVWLRRHRDTIWPLTRSMSGRIAFIRTDVLSRLGILYWRSDRLVKDIGAVPWSKDHPDGIPYIHNAHWLIYVWIPSRAIQAIVELSDYLQACETCEAAESANGTVYDKKPQSLSISVMAL